MRILQNADVQKVLVLQGGEIIGIERKSG